MPEVALAESEDDSLRALSVMWDAWEEGTGQGIAPELMAYAAMYTAMTDLVAGYGEEHVCTLVDGLSARVRSGEFTINRTKQ